MSSAQWAGCALLVAIFVVLLIGAVGAALLVAAQ